MTKPADSTDSRAPQAQNGSFKWVALAAAILLAGMLLGTSMLLYTALSVMAVLLAGRMLTNAWASSPSATRHSSALETEVGQTVHIEIDITNHSSIPVAWLLAEDLLPQAALIYKPPALEVIGDRLRVVSLAASGSETIQYDLRCHRRGYYQIGPLVFETGDLMGLHRRYRVGATPQYLLVMPKVVPLEGYEIQSRRPIGEIRMSHQFMDDPTRIIGIRDWQPGDPQRRIHWAATARSGSLQSKIYAPSSIAGATLVIDMHRSTNPARHEPVRSELAITAAASIGHALYLMNQPLGLATNARDAADRIRTEGFRTDFRTRNAAQQRLAMRDTDSHLNPICLAPSRGPVHYREVQRTLARLEMTDGLTLPETFIQLESRLARDTTLIVIIQQCDLALADTLTGFSRRGWAVVAVINTFAEDDFSLVAGPLIAGGVQVVHLVDQDSIATLCRTLVCR